MPFRVYYGRNRWCPEAYDGPSLIIAYSSCIAHGTEKDGVVLCNGLE
jgi:hypothetical protein